MQKIYLIHLFILKIQSVLESRDQTDHTHFWLCPTKKVFDQLLIFLESVSTCKKISLFYLFILQIQSIIESHQQTGHTHFWPCPPKRFSIISICMNLYQHPKNQLIPSVHFLNTVNFIVQRPDWPHPFLTMPTQKVSIIFVNLYRHVKNEAVLSDISGEIVDLKIQQSDWLTESILAYISGTRFVPNRSFHYRINSVKINNQIFFFFKGYLCYKTITSKNVPFEAQVKIFFIS